MIASPPAPVLRWRVAAEPLTGWRDDDPDALMRCSVNPEHVIRNGDRYAIADIKVACISCSALPVPAPVAPSPARPVTARNRTHVRLAGEATDTRIRRTMATPVTAPKSEPQTTNTSEPVAHERGRLTLGPPHRDHGKPTETRVCARESCEERFPVLPTNPNQKSCSQRCAGFLRRKPKPEQPAQAPRVAFREKRTCERDGCETLFVVRADNKDQRFCSNSCARRVMHANKSTPQRAPVRFAAVAPARCTQCGASFQPTPFWPLQCSWLCAMSAAAGRPADHGPACLCLACATRRQAQGVAPLIGARP